MKVQRLTGVLAAYTAHCSKGDSEGKYPPLSEEIFAVMPRGELLGEFQNPPKLTRFTVFALGYPEEFDIRAVLRY